MKRSSFNVLFFLKKTKLLKNGEASVCMRIIVDGTRVENNIRKSIDPSLWSQAKEFARGKSRKSCDLNAYIENARIKLHQIFCELEEQNQPITARLLEEIFFGQDKEPEAVRTLIGTMQEHNDQCRALVGKDYALITVRRYKSCKRYLAELVGLFNVVAPTLRAAKRRIYKLEILQPFTVEQRIPLKEGYQVVYNLEMIFALAFQINTYPAQQLREYIISRLFQSEKSMIICMVNGNHKSYLKC